VQHYVSYDPYTMCLDSAVQHYVSYDQYLDSTVLHCLIDQCLDSAMQHCLIRSYAFIVTVVLL
jgi:hypothetical protein